MQRIDATTRSPIYAHFSETLTGVETLRAYGFEERFALANEKKIDYNHKCGTILAVASLRHVCAVAPSPCLCIRLRRSCCLHAEHPLHCTCTTGASCNAVCVRCVTSVVPLPAASVCRCGSTMSACSTCICRAYFSLRMADQWLSWRLDCIAACLILIVAMLAIAQRNHLSASLTALSLTEVRLRAANPACWQTIIGGRVTFHSNTAHTFLPYHSICALNAGAGRDGVPQVRGAVSSHV